MRLAVVTQSRDRVGGLEAYIESVLPALARYHDVAFWSASETVSNRGAVALPIGVPALTVDRSAADPVHRLRAWRPDLLFAHGLDDAVLESEVFRVAQVVLVEHTYHGTCISSAKTMSWPVVHTCERRFGAACLALYFPRRCGGLNPVTMAKSFRTQSRRLTELRRAAAVVTLSAHMADEVLRNGVRPERVHIVPPFASTNENPRVHNTPGGVCRLLYLGRLERLKGVARLLAALRPVADRLQRPVRLVIAGDGAERHALESYASIICAANPRIAIQFTGWQGESARHRLLADADALVVPSLWPEPFGLVGLEAAAAGVPAVGFATGGIPEWLRDGENGCLAPSPGARPDLLADAIVRCVGTPDALARFSDGARRMAAEWTMARHIARLQDVFQSALQAAATSPAL